MYLVHPSAPVTFLALLCPDTRELLGQLSLRLAEALVRQAIPVDCLGRERNGLLLLQMRQTRGKHNYSLVAGHRCAYSHSHLLALALTLALALILIHGLALPLLVYS